MTLYIVRGNILYVDGPEANKLNFEGARELNQAIDKELQGSSVPLTVKVVTVPVSFNQLATYLRGRLRPLTADTLHAAVFLGLDTAPLTAALDKLLEQLGEAKVAPVSTGLQVELNCVHNQYRISGDRISDGSAYYKTIKSSRAICRWFFKCCEQGTVTTPPRGSNVRWDIRIDNVNSPENKSTLHIGCREFSFLRVTALAMFLGEVVDEGGQLLPAA